MFLGVEFEQPRAVAAQYGGGGDHLCIEERVGGKAAQEVAAVAVGPVHHGGDGDSTIYITDFARQNYPGLILPLIGPMHCPDGCGSLQTVVFLLPFASSSRQALRVTPSRGRPK